MRRGQGAGGQGAGGPGGRGAGPGVFLFALICTILHKLAFNISFFII